MPTSKVNLDEQQYDVITEQLDVIVKLLTPDVDTIIETGKTEVDIDAIIAEIDELKALLESYKP